MKETAFLSIHRDLGARIVEFAGYLMPVSYAGIIEEHRAVRSAVGVFDVSHMGELEISGTDALALVQRLTTNDASRLERGKIQYSAMCNPAGGIIDDLLVYHNGDHFMLVVNAANIGKDLAWIRDASAGFSVTVTDRSDSFSLLAVQGPKAHDTVGKIVNADISSLPYYSFTDVSIAGVRVLLSRTGYTGETGYELYFDSAVAAGKKVWDALFSAGKETRIRPVGLGARDTLRLEMGYCLYGNDIDETTNPLEAGLGWITRFGKEFIGREALQKIRDAGIVRKLSGFVTDEPKAVPRHGYPILHEGREAGMVTSGTLSPTLDRGIGLGYVPVGASAPGMPLAVQIRGKELTAKTVKLPFVNTSV